MNMIYPSLLSILFIWLSTLLNQVNSTWRTINTEFVGSSWPDTVKNWKIIGVSTSPSSTCSQGGSTQKIYGGIGKYGTGVILLKSYSSLPPHKNLRVSFNGYFIATQSVATNNVVTFCGDYNAATYTCNNAATLTSFNYNSAGTSLSPCLLTTGTEKIYPFSFTYAHSNLNVVLEFENNFTLQSSTLSLAISNFKLEVDACHSSCLTCNGDMFDNCLTCVAYASISNNSCVCNPGFYPQYQEAPCLTSPCFICQPCDTTCSTCFGPSATQCLTCSNTNSPTRFLQNTTCVLAAACIAGTYPNVLDLQCDPCHQSCATCTGASDILCASCATLRYLNPINVGDTTGKCVSTCPDGKVLIVKQCNPCADTDCIQCTNDQANNCLKCTSNTSLKFLLFNSSCTNVLPSNAYYQDNIQGKIFPCTSPCATCTQYSGTNCLSCIASYSLSLNTCVTTCPSGQYSLSQVCTNCNSNCLTCTGTATFCLTCNSNQFVDPADNTCKNCPAGKYGDTTTGTCKPCDPTCQTCNGGASNNCLTCFTTGSFIYYIASTLQCVADCPAFPSDLYGNDVSVPKLCVQGQFCPSAYFPDASSVPRKCNPCNSQCGQCFGSSNVQCSGCTGGLYLQGTTCIASCNPGYYGDTNYICQLCDKSCKECTGGGPNNCSTCNSPLFLYQNGSDRFCRVVCDTPTFGDQQTLQCVNVCTFGYYPNSTTRLCTICDPACNGCTGGHKKDCQNCAAPYFSFQGVCDFCPDQYFGDPGTLTCQQCPSSCAICTGLASCQKCNPNYFLDGSSCVLQCPTPTWGSYVSQTCVASCPISEYGVIVDSIQRVCYACSNNCANCTDSSNCIDCFYPYFLNNSNQCVTDCPSNQFPNRQIRVCQNCEASCKTCTGSLSSNCTSCQSGSLLYDGVCYTICPDGTYANGDYCSITCEKGYYPDAGTKTCSKCNANCLECNGSLFNNCITCPNGQFLINSYCVSVCPNGYYQKTVPITTIDATRTGDSTTVRICKQCSTECQQCSNSSWLTLNAELITCSVCAANFYLNNQLCISECPSDKIMNIPNRTCDTCPSGYYKYDYKTCKECHFSCKACTGNQYNECTSCWDTRGREQIQSDKSVIRLPYKSVCECDSGYSELMENECDSSKGSVYSTVKAAQSFSVIFGSLMFLDLYFFGNPVNLLFSFELVQQISLLQYTNAPLSLDIQQLLHFTQGFHLTDLPPKPFDLDVNSPTSGISSSTPSTTSSRLLTVITGQTSTYKFSSNNKSDNFLNNSIYLIGIHLLLWAFIFFCKLSLKNFKLKRLGILNKIYFYLDLTVMLMVFFITSYEIILNTILQLNDVNTNNSLNSLSFALCIIFLVYYSFFLIKIIFKINVDKIFFKSKPPRKPYLINQFTRWCLLFFTIRQRKPLQRNFYVLLQIKKILITIFLVTLYNYPEVQILLALFAYVVFFLYLVIQKPIVNPYILSLFLINEAFMIAFFILTFVIQQYQSDLDVSTHLNRTLLALLFLVFFTNVVISFLILFKKRNQIKQQLLTVYNVIKNFVVRKNRIKDYQPDEKEKKLRGRRKVRLDKMGDIIEEDDDGEEDDEEEDGSQEQNNDDYGEDIYVQDVEGEGASVSQNEKRLLRVKKYKFNDKSLKSQKSQSQKEMAVSYYNISEQNASQNRRGVLYLKEDLNYNKRIEFKNHLRRDQRLPKITNNKMGQGTMLVQAQKAGVATLQVNQMGRAQQNINQSINNISSINNLDNSIAYQLDNSIDQSFQQILPDRGTHLQSENNEYSIANLDQDEWNGNKNDEQLDQIDEMDEIIDEALDQDGEINMERIRQLQLKRSDQSHSPMLRLNTLNQSHRGPQVTQQQYTNFEEYIGTNEDFNNRPSSRLDGNYQSNRLIGNANPNYQYGNEGNEEEGEQQYYFNQDQEELQGADDYNMQNEDNMNVQFQELFGFDRIQYYDHSLEEEQRAQREKLDQNYRDYMRQSQQSALQNINTYQNKAKYQSTAQRKYKSKNSVGARDYTAPNLIERYNEVDPEQLKKYVEYKKKYKLTSKFGFLTKPTITSSPQKQYNNNQIRGEDPQRIAMQMQQFYKEQGINNYQDQE